MPAETTSGRLVALYRYPVKGLSPEPLSTVEVKPGETLPHDRRYAIENGPGRFDPEAPAHLPKIAFLMLMRDERLATLKTSFDPETETLTVLRDGRQVARAKLSNSLGRQVLEQFFAAYMKAELRGRPRLLEAPGHSFSDVAAKCVHIVNLASLRELERAAGRSLDPLRFRANLLLDGIPPWAELGWLDRELTVGAVRLQVFKRTVRCDATNVEPATGERNMSIPALLQRHWGHTDFGVYAKVLTAGTLAVGDDVQSPA